MTAGAEWSPRQFGLEGIVHNLGLLPYAATGALYRSCTAGVALMMTCHPSYLPFELMACGALVVTNSNSIHVAAEGSRKLPAGDSPRPWRMRWKRACATKPSGNSW